MSIRIKYFRKFFLFVAEAYEEHAHRLRALSEPLNQRRLRRRETSVFVHDNGCLCFCVRQCRRIFFTKVRPAGEISK